MNQQPPPFKREVLPCGCVCEIVGEAFVMHPCNEQCENYQYALTEARKQGKALAPIDAHSVGRMPSTYVVKCPYCLTKLDSFMGNGAPELGAFGVCDRCARVVVYGEDAIRKPTPEEKAIADDLPQIHSIKTLVHERIRERLLKD